MSQNNIKKSNYENVHWADNFAQRAIDANPTSEIYTVESGVTPSGIIHVGHFREVITMEMVRRAFENKGKKTRFIYSWDNYDAFRKVPKNLPENYEKYLRLPLMQVPDPENCHNSFGEHYISEGEKALSVFNFPIEFQYQDKLQRSGIYAEGIRTILRAEQKGEIQDILNKYRQEPLKKDWTSATLFCEKCGKDTTKVYGYDGEYSLNYICKCGHSNKINFKETPIVKLLFRTDWPMRWAYYGVNVEGGGKDYSTPGSPWFTGNEILEKIFNKPRLIGPFHNFVSMKGQNGKISSSKGDGATTSDLLKIYTPELILFLFAGTRPNAEFDISFDLDVIKIYEDFDKLERIYFGIETEKNEKKLATLKRTYELSMVTGRKIPETLPFQPSFRHLVTNAQANNFDLEKLKKIYSSEIKTEFDLIRLKERLLRVKNWLNLYAPEDMVFSILDNLSSNLSDLNLEIIKDLKQNLNSINENKQLINFFKELCSKYNLEMKELATILYNIIIGKDKGPRLSTLILENKVKIINLINN